MPEQKEVAPWAIKAAREWRGVSRDELAEILSRDTGRRWDYDKVMRLETGRLTPTMDIVAKVARLLHMPLTFFAYPPDTFMAPAESVPYIGPNTYGGASPFNEEPSAATRR